MPSFRTTLTPSKRAAVRFIGSVRRALQKALVEEAEGRGLNQSDIAREIEVHRSVINRELRGTKDLTLGRVGELAYALGRRAGFSLDRIEVAPGANHDSRQLETKVHFSTTAGREHTPDDEKAHVKDRSKILEPA